RQCLSHPDLILIGLINSLFAEDVCSSVHIGHGSSVHAAVRMAPEAGWPLFVAHAISIVNFRSVTDAHRTGSTCENATRSLISRYNNAHGQAQKLNSARHQTPRKKRDHSGSRFVHGH